MDSVDSVKTIVNGRIIAPAGIASTLAFDSKIISIDAEPAGTIIDARGNFVSPGFINLHIHGGNGSDVMDATPVALANICNWLPSTGVTAFLPTTITAPLEQIRRALDNIRNFSGSGAKVLGAYLEGPFISPKFPGSHPVECILPPDLSLLDDFLDVIKIATFAPELAPAGFIENCLSHAILPAVGHSAADFDTAQAAFASGANHVTHLFNAHSPLHHRRPGIATAALISPASVELIADNVHVHPAVIQLVWKIKKHSDIILITDSMRAAGLGDCISELAGRKVIVKDGVAKLEDGTIAASVAPLNLVLRKFRESTGASVPEVVKCATENPARRLGVDNALGTIAVGRAADLVIFDDDFNIESVIIDGEVLR